MAKTTYDKTYKGNSRANIELRKKETTHKGKKVIRYKGSVNIDGRSFVVSSNGKAK